LALGPVVLKQIHRHMIRMAKDNNRVTSGRRMRVWTQR
jgi:hypothetical protein